MAIDPFQADVARIALEAAAEHGFALAGGNALVAHGVVERQTEDVDLFSPEPGGPGAVAYAVRDALIQAGYQTELTRPPEAHGGEFARLDVTRGDDTMHVDLARDWRKWPPVQLEVGPVLHLDDAVSSKVNAMVTRHLPRDFIDVAAALDRYRRAELMRLTFTRDLGLRVVDFTDAARELDRLTTDQFRKYGLDDDAVVALRARFADWPRHEEDDREGQAVHAAVADEERRTEVGPTAPALAGQAYPSDATTPPTPDAGSAVPPTPESRSHYRPRS